MEQNERFRTFKRVVWEDDTVYTEEIKITPFSIEYYAIDRISITKDDDSTEEFDTVKVRTKSGAELEFMISGPEFEYLIS